MKRNFLMLGLPIVAGLSLTLASCGGPAAQQEDDELQQPGAVPGNVEADDDEDEPQQGGNVQEDEDEDEEENE